MLSGLSKMYFHESADKMRLEFGTLTSLEEAAAPTRPCSVELSSENYRAIRLLKQRAQADNRPWCRDGDWEPGEPGGPGERGGAALVRTQIARSKSRAQTQTQFLVLLLFPWRPVSVSYLL